MPLGKVTISATAKSPLQLTPLGESVNQSGFSPPSCRRILQFLEERTQRDEKEELVDFVSAAFQELCVLPEQSNQDLRDALTKKGKKHPVKPKELLDILNQWVDGEYVEDIFASLPSVQKSKSKVPIGDWLAGVAPGSTWDSKYDKFVEFVSGALENFIPWLLRACGTLSQFVPTWSEVVDWNTWALQIEKGVDSRWAAIALQAGAPVPRKAAVIVGRVWPEVWISDSDPLGLAAVRDRNLRASMISMLEALQQSESGQAENIHTMQVWLTEKAGTARG